MLIMSSMEQLNHKKRVIDMERVYKTMNSVGITNLILGICIVVAGCLTGSFIIVNGAKLLHRKKEVLF